MHLANRKRAQRGLVPHRTQPCSTGLPPLTLSPTRPSLYPQVNCPNTSHQGSPMGAGSEGWQADRPTQQKAVGETRPQIWGFSQ